VNVLAARVVLRPRSLADVLDLALPFCWRDRRLLSALAALALGPIAALAAFLRIGLGWRWPWVWCAVIEASFAVEGMFTVAFGELLFHEAKDVTVRSVWRRFRSLLGPYLSVTIRRQLILVVMLALVFVPFWEGPARQFTTEALLLERVSSSKAAERTRTLTKNAMGGAFLLWLATLALPALGAVVGDVLGHALAGFVLQLGEPAGSLWQNGGSGFAVAGALMAAPVAAAMRFLGYIDRRTRIEGWDIQLRFMALASGAEDSRVRGAA